MGRKYSYVLDRSRTVAFLDVDGFSAQVAVRLFPKLKGCPFATQKAPNDIIDSVSYEAKDVCKGMTVSEAKDICPNIMIVTKSQIKDFRKEEKKASDELFDVIRKFCGNEIPIEKMSVDDLFLDLSDKCDRFFEKRFTYDKKFLKTLKVVIEGGVRQFPFAHNKSFHRLKWTEAAVIISDLCAKIHTKTGLICSVGISFNKLLAKIGCKLNKPDTITIIASKPGIARIFEECPLSMCDGLGSKFGAIVQNRLKISTLKELRGFRRRLLIEMFGIKGDFLWKVCRGIDNKPVRHKIEFATLSLKHNYRRGIDCDDKRLINDLYSICEQIKDKLNKDMKRNKRIAHRIRIEVFTKSGRTLSTTTYLMSKSYDAMKIYDTVMAKRFPYITEDVPQLIYGFRIIAMDFKITQNMDAISGLTEQMSGMTLS